MSTASTMISDEGGATPKSELKENVAADESLRDSSMSSSTLSALSFESNLITTPVTTTTTLKISVPPVFHDPIPISSASSICTRESDTGAYSDVECVVPSNHSTSSSSAGSISPSVHRLYHDVSEKLNAKVCNRKTSRQGRAGQRTVTENNESIRLVTGAVPILRGGKIMFVSSRKKPEWIIPKGGWEKDEEMEESAIREVFEEAGVLGVLGPRLCDVQYETRKAKKRRLDLESMERDMIKAEADSKIKAEQNNESTEESSGEEDALLSAHDIARIRAHAAATRDKQQQQQDDKSSVASASHSQVRMMLYPLYVQKVYEDWPESGRFRKAVDIDTAIQMMDKRPELKRALIEVKERGLHLIQASELETK
mmetsp:Transcript_2453/g.4900  ORF Transcript_2453/g.4900 Transcript_2453/m.4900 type:complete len:369 (+) Transcript_2453:416-1522(+)